MKVVIQRSKNANVSVNNEIIGNISHGFVLLVGIETGDSAEDVDYLIRKISHLRIFSDENGDMNRSIHDVEGEILSISQFTLYANTKKGNRPSFIKAARPDQAIPLYESLNEGLKREGIPVETGKFGEEMKITLENDGPVTIIIDSKNR